jgi:hypothetical protein
MYKMSIATIKLFIENEINVKTSNKKFIKIMKMYMNVTKI